MTDINITGQYVFASGQLASNEKMHFRLKTQLPVSVLENKTYLTETITVQLDAEGKFPAGFTLPAPDVPNQYWRWNCTQPDNREFQFILGYNDRPSISFTELNSRAGVSTVALGASNAYGWVITPKVVEENIFVVIPDNHQFVIYGALVIEGGGQVEIGDNAELIVYPVYPGT